MLVARPLPCEVMVFERAAAENVPIAWVLAGGYTSGEVTVDELVDLHLLTVDAATSYSDDAVWCETMS